MTTDEIDARKQRAESLSIANTGGMLGWPKYYDLDSDREQMRKDFCWMLAEIKLMRARTYNLECKLEAAGVEV